MRNAFRIFSALICVGIAQELEEGQTVNYASYSNHDGTQIGTKYIYFAAPQGQKAIPKTFNEAVDACAATGGQLAYPENSDENDAIMSYLSDHFLANLEDLEAGLGAWIGIYINETGDFVYPDGSLAGWIPDQYFSRLVADFAVCLSINSGKVS